MKRKRHSPEEIIRKLRQADAELAAGQPIAAICQKLGVAEATFHRSPWRLRRHEGQRRPAPEGAGA